MGGGGIAVEPRKQHPITAFYFLGAMLIEIKSSLLWIPLFVALFCS